MLYVAEWNDRLVPCARKQLVTEAPPWQPRISEELDVERKCHYIDAFLLFCVLLIPQYSLFELMYGEHWGLWQRSWGCWRQRRWEGRTYIEVREESVAVPPFDFVQSGKTKILLLTVPAFSSNCTITGHCIRIYVNFGFHLLFFPLPVSLKCTSRNTWARWKNMSLYYSTWSGNAEIMSNDFCK